MPDPGENIQSWSTTALDNGTADSLIIWAEGQSRASVNNSARSMMAAHAKDRNLRNGSIVTGGSANAQTFISGVGYTAVPAGLHVLLKIGPSLTNTGSTTLDMDSTGAVEIKGQSAISLIGGELIAGGYAELVYDGTNWILVREANLVPANTPTVIINEQIIISPVTELSFTTGLTDTTFEEFRFLLSGVEPSSPTGVNLCCRVSSDGGVTYSTLGYWYAWQFVSSHIAPQTLSSYLSGGADLTYFRLVGSQNGGAGKPCSGEIMLSRPWSTTQYKLIQINMAVFHENDGGAAMHGGGVWFGSNNPALPGPGRASPINAVKFFYTSGQIATGTFRLFGVRG